MRTYIVIVTLFFTYSLSFSQGKKIIYFDEDWDETTKDSAYYYREAYYDEYNNPLGTVIDYYISGKVQMEVTCTNRGVKVGDCIWYYENGNKKEFGNYSYYNNGRYSIISAWNKEGDKIINSGTGIMKSYYSNNNLKFEGEYSNSNRVGDWKFYYRNGQLAEEGYYDGGIFHIDNSWDEKGVLQIVEGNGEYVRRYKNGQIKCMGKCEEGVRQGECKWWFKNGQIKEKLTYLNGLASGEFLSWFSFGKPYCKGKYKDGKKNGEWIWYREDGSELPVEYYDRGKYTDQRITD